MTVQELIDELKKYDPDSTVAVDMGWDHDRDIEISVSIYSGVVRL